MALSPQSRRSKSGKAKSGRSFFASLQACTAKSKDFDVFGQEFSMSIEHGQSGVNSYIGTFFTLVLITITGFYSYHKTTILLRRRDTDVFTYTS